MQFFPEDTSWFSVANGVLAGISSIITIIFSLMPSLEVGRSDRKLNRINLAISHEKDDQRLLILETERLWTEAKVVAHQIYPLWKIGFSFIFCLAPLFYITYRISHSESLGVRVLVLLLIWVGCFVLVDAWIAYLFQNRVVKVFYFYGKPLPNIRMDLFNRKIPSRYSFVIIEVLASLNLSFYFYNYFLLSWCGAGALEALGKALVVVAVNSNLWLISYRIICRELEKRAFLLLNSE